MKIDKTIDRRKFLNFATIAIATSSAVMIAGPLSAQAGETARFHRHSESTDPTMGEIKQVKAGVLNIGYAEFGPANGIPVILLHGWPYDIHSYIEVAPMLAKQGFRVIVPYLRGHGSTVFLDPETSRSGEQASIGADLIALLDALKIERALFAGYDWGARAACVAAALWPKRCLALVSGNGYLIQDIAKASEPVAPEKEMQSWYQYYFLTERGKTGLTRNRDEIARLMWTRLSPKWHFTEEAFNRTTASRQNPDYVEIVLHSYRHRLGSAKGFPEYEQLEKQLALLPNISVATITLDGESDGFYTPTDGKSSASKFTGLREHRIVADAGHNLPQENPAAFVQAVIDVFKMAK